MTARLSLSSAELDLEDLQHLTRDFCRTAEREAGLQAEQVQATAGPGARSGEALTVGHLLLTFVSSGAAVALINVCKSFFERNASIEFSLERRDGSKLAIKAQNVSPDQIAGTLGTVREFFESP